MKTEIQDTPEIRRARLDALRAGSYRFSPPPVCHVAWSDEDWCNHVRFDRPELNGYLKPNDSSP